ncbi:MAG: glucose-1-phosphate thymidylyltransferase RfbA [Candidatus Omnitrophota bacterium]|nr:glucose-1-phosphate thymidylyltransferase RfbA [Candidatus Omnitrophota bacterium]
MKGIILAGGKATRLYPVTRVISKQLLPVYDKPMIYYPLSVLMLANIKDILIISTPQDLPRFKELLADGRKIGIKISYSLQDKPLGIAESLIIAEDFIGLDSICLILGDNIFYGHNLGDLLREHIFLKDGAVIFGYYVKDPCRYGVIELNSRLRAVSIQEKPKKPKSNFAVTGLYFYDNKALSIVKKLTPSKRGELEITGLNNEYLKKGKLKVRLLDRGYAWLDTGTYDSLIEASMFIKTIEERQGLKIGCIEEIAYRMGYIKKEELKKLAESLNTGYREYLLKVACEVSPFKN